MTLMERRRALMVGQNKPLLPSEFQQVEWIQSDGNQAINMGIGSHGSGQADNILRYTLEVDAAVTETNPNVAIIMSKGQQSGCWMGVVNSGTNIGMSGTSVFANINIAERQKYQLYWSGSGNSRIGHCVCGAQELTRAASTLDLVNFSLFAGLGKTQIYYESKCRIYHAKITDSGVLARDFYPCYRKADGVIGMFDLANDVFYVNSGTGTFTKGADVK